MTKFINYPQLVRELGFQNHSETPTQPRLLQSYKIERVHSAGKKKQTRPNKTQTGHTNSKIPFLYPIKRGIKERRRNSAKPK